jgi:hypothetical protein
MIGLSIGEKIDLVKIGHFIVKGKLARGQWLNENKEARSS